MKRVILHYDMDAFFASVEIRDNIKYKNRPLVVAGGVVTTASYEARKFGIHSAMSVIEAKRLCSKLLVIPVNKEKYIQESNKIQNLVLKITNKVEFISLDEGYLDITDIIEKFSSKKAFGDIFRKRIFECTGLTCSVGIGINKLTAKIASDINKPGGQYIFNSSKEFEEYIKDKKIRKLPGVGSKFEKILEKDKFFLVGDVLKFSLKELIAKYGNSRGEILYMYSRGIDYREIDYSQTVSSIGNENTFRIALESDVEIVKEIDELFEWTYRRLIEQNFLTKTIILKVRFNDRETITRSKTISIPTKDKIVLREIVDQLLNSINFIKEVKLLGISFGNLQKYSKRQLYFEEFK